MAKNPYILDKVRNFLVEDDWRFQYDEERDRIRLNISLNGKVRECTELIYFYSHFYIVYGTIAINADEGCRAVVADYLHRVNYGLRFGNFEMDMNDGEIRYKCLVDCGDEVGSYLNRDMISRSIVIPAKMIQQYGDGLLAVMYGFKTPKDAEEEASS